MRYQDFINELKDLIAGGDAMRSQTITHEDAAFREWRHRAENLVGEVAAHGYRLPGAFKSDVRTYRAMYPGASFPANTTALKKELGDSLIELRYLIDQYEKYGEPVRTQLVQQSSNNPGQEASNSVLVAPETVSLAWLVKNVSISFWLKVGSIAVALVLLGAAIGQTEPFTSVVQWFKANWPF